MIHTDPSKRHDFVLLFDVRSGNPNGDPDADNQPRVDPATGRGIVTDVAIKRKIRNVIDMLQPGSIFIQSEHTLNSLIAKGFADSGIAPVQTPMGDEEVTEWFEENNPEGFSIEEGVLIYAGESAKRNDIQQAIFEGLDDADMATGLRTKLLGVAKALSESGGKKVAKSDRQTVRQRLCKDYYDIRMFGAVLSTGLNAGQVRGPMQLSPAISKDRIRVLNLTLTRNARTTAARMQTGDTEMGRKWAVPYALYESHGFFSPILAKQTGVSSDDLEAFWAAFHNDAYDLFTFDRSAARGEMRVCEVFIFSHATELGNAPAHRLFQLVSIAKNPEVSEPESCDDYSIDDAPQSGPLDALGFPGVTLTRLVG
ncbi:MAG: type I CRISPR-associated protein Cas7 [Dehalococcoidia bacterium]